MQNQLPICENCPHFEDVERIRRNKQFDIIYCRRCKHTFERRMKPWHCPFSPIVNKDNLEEENNEQ